ncbi:MAG: M64 family metallopeptidase [Rubrimonas sp.]
MGTSDGTVVGLTKLHDSGLPADRLNLVITGDGYTAAQMADFRAHADELVARIFATPPFDEEAIACAFNIYRLDVESDQTGADEPNCGGSGGTTADTYFDSTYCFDGSTDRLLYGDTAIVSDTMDIWLPEWTQVVVLVNGSKRGGGGGSMAFLSTSSVDWRDVAIHELGHSIFDLADEYDDDQPENSYTGGEPMRVNITIEPDPTLVKWNGLVTAGPASPTWPNTDCSTGNPGPAPGGAAIVGTFEGASRFNCGIYRPRDLCKMRRSTHPSFCPVCEQQIRDVMATYAAPSVTGDITQETTSLTFADIPEGTSTVRPATWLVDSCLPVTFRVVAPPPAPFSVAFDPIVVSTPGGGSVRQAKLWIRYDAGVLGSSATGSVEVEIVETGEIDTVSLSGNAVQRPTAAVQLVLDRSGSMLGMTSEGRTKEEVLQDSARILADVAYPETGLGVTTYDEDWQDVLEIVVAGPMTGGVGRGALDTAIQNYSANPDGLTATGDGIERAKTKLDLATSYDEHAMIVLTDGKDTASKSVGEVADGVINQRVFAIGLGTAEQINPATLTALAGATGGYTLMTGLLTPDDTFKLEKHYLQILAGATNQDIILDPEGHLKLGGVMVEEIPFDVAETDIEITAVVLSSFPQALLVGLRTPDGTMFSASDIGPGFTVTVSHRSHVLRAALPLVDASTGAGYREGRWRLILRIDEKEVLKALGGRPNDDVRGDGRKMTRRSELLEDLRLHGVKYSAIVQTYSNLSMRVDVSQTGHQPGSDIAMKVRLTEYGGPLQGSATVTVQMTEPSGAVRHLPMADAGEGEFTAMSSAPFAGLYQLRFLARGRTFRERPFTREEMRTVSIYLETGDDRPTGDPSGGGDAPGGFADLFCCLLKKGALDDRFYRRAEEFGIEPGALKECLERLCRDEMGGGADTDQLMKKEMLRSLDAFREFLARPDR